jgi:ssRNA-specific RNase YbeY (16S rRNA maturation enzyme)
MARMHAIQIIPAHKKYSVKGPWLRRKVSALLRAERCPVSGLNIILTDSARLRSLNRALGCAFPAELWRLVVHGLLHLMGHTHRRGDTRRRMEKKELAYA